MSQPSAQMTAAEISRIAGVTRATVSNWRRRHDDFPAPSGGTTSSRPRSHSRARPVTRSGAARAPRHASGGRRQCPTSRAEFVGAYFEA